MTKAEIDDIFGEFEIDEDYMIKTKDVIGLFVASRRSPRSRSPPLLRRPLRPSLRRTPTPRRRRRRRRRRPPSKLAPFSTFLPRLWPTLTSRPTLKTPHSKQDVRTIWGRKSSKQYCRLVFDFNEYQFDYEFAIYQ